MAKKDPLVAQVEDLTDRVEHLESLVGEAAVKTRKAKPAKAEDPDEEL